MAKANFTTEEINVAQTCLLELFQALPRADQPDFLNHFTAINLILDTAEDHVRTEPTKEQP